MRAASTWGEWALVDLGMDNWINGLIFFIDKEGEKEMPRGWGKGLLVISTNDWRFFSIQAREGQKMLRNQWGGK